MLDVDGRPCEDYYVAVVGMERNNIGQETDWYSTRTDADGRFRIEDLRAELDPVLLVRRELRGMQVLALGVIANGSTADFDAGTVRLAPRRLIQGRVVGRGNTPVAGRVFVSLEHHWNVRFGAGDENQAFPGRAFLLAFAELVRARGEFDWHLAFHPYPENLFECRFWNDHTAPDTDEAAKVTFRNLPVLLRFLDQPEMTFNGRRRRVILSEQGFHCADGEHGERDQAAAFAAAWTLVENTKGIDAFLLHRHVDHAHEGGLRLGLWSRAEDSVCTPDRQRWMYRVFRAAGTEAFAEEAAFALPVIGIESWADLPDRLSTR